MGQNVLKCTADMIEKMKFFYKDSIQESKPQASVFFAKTPGCSITAYRSGKVLFQGKKADEEFAIWNHEDWKVKPRSNKKKSGSSAPPDNIAALSVIGSDEVGTGDYFGPITVAVVYISSDQITELQQVGLKDSKLLNDKQINEMAEVVKPKVTYKLLTLGNSKYNDLRDRGMTQGKMKAMMHNQALRHVLKQMNGAYYDGILIDQFAAPDLYFKYLQGQPEIIKEKTWFQTKAESLHLSVAAASIIARQAFVMEIDRLGEEAGMELPKGAGAHVDEAAARLIQQKGTEFLRKVAKLHFANTKRAMLLSQAKR
ncbi:MAG TPA: ribonuclease HIII [Bacillales bacterium]|nr:ribonuclease HIII [Bacillales bacterium]